MENRRDLTTGNLGRKLFFFALPILAIDFLQALYNVVDMIVVGQFIGSAGMSAVSIGGQITHLLFAICKGFSNSSSAYIGQLYGARKRREASRVAGTLFSLVALLALGITAAVFLLMHPLLRAMNTPVECYHDTVLYLYICVGGTLFDYMYTVIAAALRGIGESLHPMYFVIITTVENMILDVLFVAGFRWGAAGAAMATVICQATSMVLVIRFTVRHTELFDFHLRSFRIHRDKLKNILRLGVPQAIQHSSTNVSFLLVSAMINRFGVIAAAAAGAANKIWNFGILPARSMNSAMVTLTAQNHPQKQYTRIRSGFLLCLGAGLTMAGMVMLLCQLFPAGMYRIFTSDPAIPAIGVAYLRIYAVSFIPEVFWFCIAGVLVGSGYTLISMCCSICSAFLVRTVLAHFLSQPAAMGFNGIALAYVLAPCFSIAVGAFYLLSGRWKVSRIDVGE